MRSCLRRHSPLLIAAIASPAFAETPAPAVGVPVGTFIQGILGLGLIIGLLLVTLAALRRFGGRFQGAQTTGLKVISGLSVGARERILLIEVGDTWLVVGVTTTNIRTLHTLPKGSLPAGNAPGDGPVFADWLNRIKDKTRHER
jgi:flagellar protein FliO/FliZ